MLLPVPILTPFVGTSNKGGPDWFEILAAAFFLIAVLTAVLVFATLALSPCTDDPIGAVGDCDLSMMALTSFVTGLLTGVSLVLLTTVFFAVRTLWRAWNRDWTADDG